MIYSLTGTLVHTEPGAAVVDVGGVAFRCMTSMNTLRGLPRLSEKVTLYTYLNVREDALDLFGFATKGELSCFRLLTSIYRSLITPISVKRASIPQKTAGN